MSFQVPFELADSGAEPPREGLLCLSALLDPEVSQEFAEPLYVSNPGMCRMQVSTQESIFVNVDARRRQHERAVGWTVGAVKDERARQRSEHAEGSSDFYAGTTRRRPCL